MTTTTMPVARSSWLKRLRVPLIAFALPLVLLVTLIVFDRFELMPQANMWLMMGVIFSTELAILVVAVWFLFFSGFRVWVKLAGVLMVAVLVGAAYFVPRRWDFNGMMMPIPISRSQPDIAAELEERLAHVSRADAPGLTAADLAVAADDFPRYRGAAADGVAAPVALADWSAQPPKIVWRTPVGWAYSGIAVAGKVAVTIEQRDEAEAVVCYDRATGAEHWSYAYPARFNQSAPMGGIGPRATPTIADADVYSLGAKGDLVCLDGTTGALRWAVNVVKDNGAKVLQWGMTSSPLIVGDLVIVNAGIDPDDNRKQAVAAYDRKTGKKAWASGAYGAGYSSPLLARLADIPQIVLFDAGGLVGIDPADGRELWRFPWATFNDMNIIQPLVLPGDRIFISSEIGNGCALVQVKKTGSSWSADKVWQNHNMGARFANPVVCAGHIYGLSNGRLCCLDAATGRRTWKSDARFDSGQLLVTGNTLVVQTEGTGEVVTVDAEPAEYRELGRFKVFRGSRTWNTPTLAGGRLYLRNHEEMVCLDPSK